MTQLSGCKEQVQQTAIASKEKKYCQYLYAYKLLTNLEHHIGVHLNFDESVWHASLEEI